MPIARYIILRVSVLHLRQVKMTTYNSTKKAILVDCFFLPPNGTVKLFPGEIGSGFFPLAIYDSGITRCGKSA